MYAFEGSSTTKSPITIIAPILAKISHSPNCMAAFSPFYQVIEH